MNNINVLNTNQGGILPDISSPRGHSSEPGDAGALIRIFNGLSSFDQQELPRFAIELARKSKD